METNGHLPRRSAPKPPKERRERRAVLEAALLRGDGMDVILADLGPRYGVSPRTLRSDRQQIERRWAEDDAAHLGGLRARAVRRMERLADKAEAAGDIRGAVQAGKALGGFLGLGTAQAMAVAQAGGQILTAIDLVALYEAEEADPPPRG